VKLQKHIIFDGRFLAKNEPSGIRRDSEAFLEEFLKNEWSIQILGFRGMTETSELVARNSELLTRSSLFLETFKAAAFRMQVEIRDTNPSFFFQSQISPIKVKNQTVTLPRVIRVHDVFPITNPEWFTKKAVLNFKAGIYSLTERDTFIVNSKYTREKLLNVVAKRIDPGNIEIVPCKLPNFASTKPCSLCMICSGGVSIPQEYLLAVGTVEPRKNYSRLVEAWKNSRVQKQGIKLVIIGRIGWLSSETVRHIQNQTSTILLTNICDFQLNFMYHNAFAFISASVDEGFDIPISEARFHGLTILASDIPVHRENFENQNNIVWFKPLEVDSLTEAINTLDGAKKNTSIRIGEIDFSENFSLAIERISERLTQQKY